MPPKWGHVAVLAMSGRLVMNPRLTPEIWQMLDKIPIDVLETYLEEKWHLRVITDETYKTMVRRIGELAKQIEVVVALVEKREQSTPGQRFMRFLFGRSVEDRVGG